MTNEQDWTALSGGGLDIIEWTAVDVICHEFLWPAAELNSDRSKLGTIAIADVGLLDGFIGGGLEELVADIDCIVDENGANYGWAIAVAIALRICETKTARVMNYVLAEERHARAAGHGQSPWVPTSGRPLPSEEMFFSGFWEEVTRPMLDLLRSWCGEKAVGVQESLALARHELSRIGEMFAAAVALLADAGDELSSWAIYKAAYPNAKKRDWRGAVAVDRDERERWRASLASRKL